jgi:GH25 family lysozyme M1 (1,4-beta-N-acetylmuramidase)/LysM repeat protein
MSMCRSAVSRKELCAGPGADSHQNLDAAAFGIWNNRYTTGRRGLSLGTQVEKEFGMLVGIDVSDFQGVVDWDSVAQTHQFAFCKATEGTGFVAHTFQQNWAGIKAAGIVRGAYHFARPDNNAPEDEANHFLQQVGDQLEPGDLLALDLETGTGDKSGWALTFLQTVAAQTGFRPLLYSGRGFLNDLGCIGNDDLAQHGLWLAAFSSRVPQTPPNWAEISFWQHTDSASVLGVGGNVDESFFFRDADALAALGKPDATPTPAPTPTPTPAPTPTPTPEPVAPAPGDYLARQGDTIDAIAAAIGVPSATVLALNPQITDPAAINVGDVVHLPPFAPPAPADPSATGAGAATSKTVTVAIGDTMTSIASKNGVSLLALERANPQIADPNAIAVGEVLTLPT